MDGTLEVTNALVEKYRTYLLPGRHRPPSQGGITEALYSHVLTINGEKYSFLAFGSHRWVLKSKGDRVSFRYVVKDGYKNVVRETLRTVDGKGQSVTRGQRALNGRIPPEP